MTVFINPPFVQEPVVEGLASYRLKKVSGSPPGQPGALRGATPTTWRLRVQVDFDRESGADSESDSEKPDAPKRCVMRAIRLGEF